MLNPTGMTPTQHYGPYASGSPDSGTCGNDWAQDTFNRDFTARSNGDGTYTVVEQFKNGSFVTQTNPSPGACETYTNHGLTIDPGKTGSMHGYFIISNVVGPQNNSPYCDATNNTNAGCTHGDVRQHALHCLLPLHVHGDHVLRSLRGGRSEPALPSVEERLCRSRR